ncbi:hypothetical protein [Aestuariivirga sp.]|uniref:hypothetical protein n=1 Tax=Aestuariivirga sp. TaxID=2650926 RepID=UPI0039E30958
MNIIAKLALSAGLLAAACSAAEAKVNNQNAPTAAVLKACDNTPGCDYHLTQDGAIVGCSKHACFNCGRSGCVGITDIVTQPKGDRPKVISVSGAAIKQPVHLMKPGSVKVIIPNHVTLH